LALANVILISDNGALPRTNSKESLMSRPRGFGAVIVVVVSLLPTKLAAQSTDLVDQMSNFFVQNVVLSRTPAGNGVVAHTPVFLNDPRVTDVTALIDQVSHQIGSQVSNIPLGSSSGGFTYAYDSSLGSFSRTSNTFGPAFAERGITVGKKQFSFGMNYLHSSYSSLDGLDLTNGAIKFNLLHQALTPPSYVEGDVVQAALQLNLSTDTTAFLLNYGVTDKLDVGLAVPIVRVKMDLTYHATILDFATHAVSPTTHVFANGGKTQDFATSGSASGLGDIAIVAKYNLLRQGTNALAAAVDLKLPSGDENNMLGSGSTVTRVFLVGSGGDRVSPHFNVGYTFASGASVSNEMNYVGGVEFAPMPKLTLIGDLVGRTAFDSTRFNTSSTAHSFQQGPTAPLETTSLQSISATTGSLSTGFIALGGKFNPAGRLLISAHLLIPYSDQGLKAGVTPVIGFDYSF
jgi:hypothetical protein